MVAVRFGDGRTDRSAGMVKKLVLQPHGHVCDGLAIVGTEVRVGGKKCVQLALADLISMIAKLLEQRAGGLLMAEQGIAGSRLALDDHQGGIESLLPPLPVLLGLGPKIVDMIERHLVEVADAGVKVAGNGNIEDESQAVSTGALNADVPLQRDNRLSRGGRGDDQVGFDECLPQTIKRNSLTAPADRGPLGTLAAPIGDQDPPGMQRF